MTWLIERSLHRREWEDWKEAIERGGGTGKGGEADAGLKKGAANRTYTESEDNSNDEPRRPNRSLRLARKGCQEDEDDDDATPITLPMNSTAGEGRHEHVLPHASRTLAESRYVLDSSTDTRTPVKSEVGQIPVVDLCSDGENDLAGSEIIEVKTETNTGTPRIKVEKPDAPGIKTEAGVPSETSARSIINAKLNVVDLISDDGSDDALAVPKSKPMSRSPEPKANPSAITFRSRTRVRQAMVVEEDEAEILLQLRRAAVEKEEIELQLRLHRLKKRKV